MKTLIDLLGPLGLLVIAASQIAPALGRTLPGRPAIYLIAGAVMMLLHLVLRFDAIARALGRRQLKYGGNAVLMSAAVLALLVGVNYFAGRHTKRWDLTKGQRFGLSDQSRKVVQGLKDDVELIYFLNQREQQVTKEAEDRLKEYAVASRRLKVAYVDPLKEPARAREHDLKAVPTLVLRRGDKTEKIQSASLTEQEVTNALIKLTREAKKKVCFLAGEGERSIDQTDEGGFSSLRAALEKNHYEVETISLIRENQVPQGCSLVVVGGPQKDPQPEVIDGLRGYVKSGGKALLMVEPELSEAFPRFTTLLGEWGIEAKKDTVLEVYARLTAEGIVLRPDERIVVQQYPFHEITKDFPFVMRLQTARSLVPATTPPTGVRVETLLQTSPNSWAETDLASLASPALDEARDKRGPISIATTATIEVAQPSPAPDKTDANKSEADKADEKKREGRVAAFGDSDFAANANLGYEGNQDFVLNTFAWLSEDEDLIAIRPRDPEDQRLFLTARQEKLVYGTALALLPGLCLFAGIYAWWRRRS